MKLGIIQGSNRAQANTPGISQWAAARIKTTHPDIVTSLLSLRDLDLPVEVDPLMPKAHKPTSPFDELAKTYASPKVQSWSRTISGCDAILIVTPEWNCGVPSPLKNAIDQLYHEWVNRPLGLFVFGGGGGGQCLKALQTTLNYGVQARVASKTVSVKLPQAVFFSGKPLQPDAEFLEGSRDDLDALVAELVESTKETARA